jgi:hypothetical protein
MSLECRDNGCQDRKPDGEDLRADADFAMAAPVSGPSISSERPWWESRWLALALILAAAIPLLYPPVPPLVDLMGHMGRYRVELDLATSPWLRHYYDFRWAAIGNLGVDVLVMPLGKLLGLEPAVKLIVLVIPPLTVAGFLWVSSEVNHRLPPTALFAVPFAYSHPFMFGFVNFALSMALAFLAFGLWLRLARLGRLRLRAILFVPISVVVFFAHTFGWGTLGLLCFSAEAVRQHDRGVGWLSAAWRAALHASVMAIPAIIMLAWRSETHGGMTSGWFEYALKLNWLIAALRDRWHWFDVAAVIAVLIVIVEARRRPELTFSRNLAFSALVLVAAFLVMPWTVFGSAYADMRLIPYALAVAVLGIRFRNETNFKVAQAFAVAGLAFVLIRLAGTTASLAMAWNNQQAKLAALDHVPMGARVVSLVGVPCGGWPLSRDTHLGAMVIVEKQGFSNDQWVIEGANLLSLKYVRAGKFAADPSQIVRPDRCKIPGVWSIDDALKSIPPHTFDYVWMVDAPPFDERLAAGMQPVWRGPGSILYRLQP